MLLPDHPAPICKRTHTIDPVPFMIYRSNDEAVGVECFCEKSAEAKGNYVPEGHTLMELFVKK
jgi:2,3-bisphosphoglycerate-independent phosphoglycerate mutase